MSEERLDFQDFCDVVEFILYLPGSTAPVERMRATLVVKQKCVMECEKFYDKVLKDRNLLRKITSSEKYSQYDRGEIQSSS
jgi:hypothetical protein